MQVSGNIVNGPKSND